MPWKCVGEWRCNFTILNLGTTYSWVVSYTPLENSLCPLYMKLDGPQSQPGCYGEEKHYLPLSGVELWLLGNPACSLVTLYWLSYQIYLSNVMCEKTKKDGTDLQHVWYQWRWICYSSTVLLIKYWLHSNLLYIFKSHYLKYFIIFIKDRCIWSWSTNEAYAFCVCCKLYSTFCANCIAGIKHSRSCNQDYNSDQTKLPCLTFL